MKQAIAFLLICAVLGQSLNRLVMFVNYSINKDFITATLCENKDKAELQCHGKCHLKKQVEQEEKKEKSNGIVVKEVDTNWEQAASGGTDVFLQLNIQSEFTPYRVAAYQCAIASVFHPPSA